MLVQGVIDAYFEEGGGLVLVDYKSDVHVTEDILKNRYSRQLGFYRKALEQLTGMKVKESILYSFWLNKPIMIWAGIKKIFATLEIVHILAPRFYVKLDK